LAARWRVITVWQCALGPSALPRLVRRIVNWLEGKGRFLEIPAFVLNPRRPYPPRKH
jgi:G:T-mismatch repair DNA endonuclease (very short patch repair protein)